MNARQINYDIAHVQEMSKRAGGAAGAPNNLNNLIMGRRIKVSSQDREEVLNIAKMASSGGGKNMIGNADNQSSLHNTIKTVDF